MLSVTAFRRVGVASIGVTALLLGLIVAPAAAEEVEPDPDVVEEIPADSVSADSEEEASRIAVAHGHEVVVDAATSEYELLSALPDGTMQLEVSSEPVRIRQGGSWVDVDTSLVTGTSGMLEPVASMVPVRFSAGGDGPLAQVRDDSGEWLSEFWTLGALPAPMIDGNVAVYSEVLPGVDLRLAAKVSGMSEVLVIKSAEAAAQPALASLDLHVDGVQLQESAEGGIEAAGPGELRSAVPEWWDSAAEDASADGPGGIGVGREVLTDLADTPAPGRQVVSLQVTESLPADVVYPVFVDPDWTGGSVRSWFIDQAYPNQSYSDGGPYTDGVQKAGFVHAAWSEDGRDHRARSIWQLNTSGVKGKRILAAQFQVQGLYSSSCTATAVELWRVNATPGATWNQTPESAWVQGIDWVFFAAGRPGCETQPMVGLNAKVAVEAAAAASAATVTLGLRAADENDPLGWKRFAVSAKLVISYNSKPSTPTGATFTSPSRSCSTSSSSPVWISNKAGVTLRASFKDPDAGNVKGNFQIVKATATSTVVHQGSSASQAQGNQSFTIPANKLADGFYAWKAQTQDGTGDTSAWSGLCYFQVRNSGPKNLPGIQVSGTPTVGKALTVTFTTDLNDGVDRIAYYVAPTAIGTGFTLPVLPNPLPACGATVGVVKVLCPDSAGKATMTYVPTESISTVWATSYDKVGNPALNDGKTGAGKQLNAADDPNVSLTKGHAWWTQQMTSPLPDSLLDANSTKPVSLNLGNTAVRTALGNPLAPTSPLQKPVLSFKALPKPCVPPDCNVIPPPPGGTTIAPSIETLAIGATPTASEAAGVIDTTKSFTVAAWLKPAETVSTRQVALAESGSRMMLGADGADWVFCIDPDTANEVCARKARGAGTSWAFVTGTWDAANKQLRLYVGNVREPAATATLSLPAGETSRTAGLSVGGTSPSGSKMWGGQLANPSVFQGIATQAQRSALMYGTDF